MVFLTPCWTDSVMRGKCPKEPENCLECSPLNFGGPVQPNSLNISKSRRRTAPAKPTRLGTSPSALSAYAIRTLGNNFYLRAFIRLLIVQYCNTYCSILQHYYTHIAILLFLIIAFFVHIFAVPSVGTVSGQLLVQ